MFQHVKLSLETFLISFLLLNPQAIFFPCHNLMGIYVNWKISNILAYFFPTYCQGLFFFLLRLTKKCVFPSPFFSQYSRLIYPRLIYRSHSSKNVVAFDEEKYSCPSLFVEVVKFLWYMEIMNTSFRPGMHNIRPAGRIWSADTFKLARKARNLVLLASFLDKCTLNTWKQIILALGYWKKNFRPAMRFEFCS